MHWAEIICPCRAKNGLKAQINSARWQHLGKKCTNAQLALKGQVTDFLK